jgi:hypothetical protein
LFVCFVYPPKQVFSYLAAVTITGDRAANLDLYVALMAFSSEGSFMCHKNVLHIHSNNSEKNLIHIHSNTSRKKLKCISLKNLKIQINAGDIRNLCNVINRCYN